MSNVEVRVEGALAKLESTASAKDAYFSVGYVR
jgi:hypothetical protein